MMVLGLTYKNTVLKIKTYFKNEAAMMGALAELNCSDAPGQADCPAQPHQAASLACLDDCVQPLSPPPGLRIPDASHVACLPGDEGLVDCLLVVAPDFAGQAGCRVAPQKKTHTQETCPHKKAT